MDTVDDYFSGFLASRMHRPLLDGYAAYNALCCIAFRDTGAVWRLEIRDGMIVGIAPCGNGDEPVRFEVDVPVFMGIVRGRISPQEAFFRRRTEIRGSLFEGMKLAKVLGLFFEKYPYEDENANGAAER